MSRFTFPVLIALITIGSSLTEVRAQFGPEGPFGAPQFNGPMFPGHGPNMGGPGYDPNFPIDGMARPRPPKPRLTPNQGGIASTQSQVNNWMSQGGVNPAMGPSNGSRNGNAMGAQAHGLNGPSGQFRAAPNNQAMQSTGGQPQGPMTQAPNRSGPMTQSQYTQTQSAPGQGQQQNPQMQGQPMQGQARQVQGGQVQGNQSQMGQAPIANQNQPRQSQVAQGQVAQGQVAQGQVAQGQVAQGQVGQGQQMQGQAAQGQAMQSQAVPNQTRTAPVAPQPSPGQNGTQQPQTLQQPISTNGPAAVAPSNDNATDAQNAPINGAAVPSSVETTALQALGGLAGAPTLPRNATATSAMPPVQAARPAPAAQQMAQQPGSQPSAPAGGGAAGTASFVGPWVSKLPNGTVIRLNLQANGTFQWSVNKSGKVTSFEGTYTIDNNSLSLARSDDSQSMSGKITMSGNNAFNYKLTGAQDTGINFTQGS